MIKMAVWSGLLRSTQQILQRNKSLFPIKTFKNGTIVRLMSGHQTFPMAPSRWHWHKTKDLIHLYVCVGAIPIGISIFLINVFVGPATLEPIPEGYEPKAWEYYRHPITRFYVRYIATTEQQEYEKYMHHLWTEQEVRKCRELEDKIRNLMGERGDYQAFYYEPYTNAKYVRKQAQLEKDSVQIWTEA